ncbi:MAG: phospholipid transport system substrate-binding protein [Phenylobacterium sp.]|jgi:phospholipid transport system substrate-binding protein
MMRMKRVGSWLLSMVAAIAFTGWFNVQAAETTEDPYKMIQRVAESTFKRIVDEQQLINEDANYLKTVVREELMPYINYKLTAKIVLGKTRVTKAEKKAFYIAFNKYLITTYATVFTKYTNQKVVFEAPRSIEGKKVVTVKTRIIDGSRPDIHIDFKVRLNKKTGQWRAYDMVAEGISLLNTKKAELKGLLRKKGGVAEVTNLLTEKAKASIKRETKNSV